MLPNDPLVVEDNDKKTGETGASTRATSVESEIVEQATCGGDGGITTTVYPLHAITVPASLAKRHQDQGGSALDEEEWEIVRIVGKRRRGKGYEYKVCWKETWLLERELENAQELLRKFEAKHQAQRRGKRGRPARADKGQ
ncbi:MAG: hypothetical protein L6R38_008375 [Xanthoria sp. 2 TBL-2021]|nr:MAG: hypothetical protein L6R38_008375 [Xanthoria sp. 2 TBL-2021]